MPAICRGSLCSLRLCVGLQMKKKKKKVKNACKFCWPCHVTTPHWPLTGTEGMSDLESPATWKLGRNIACQPPPPHRVTRARHFKELSGGLVYTHEFGKRGSRLRQEELRGALSSSIIWIPDVRRAVQCMISSRVGKVTGSHGYTGSGQNWKWRKIMPKVVLPDSLSCWAQKNNIWLNLWVHYRHFLDNALVQNN